MTIVRVGNLDVKVREYDDLEIILKRYVITNGDEDDVDDYYNITSDKIDKSGQRIIRIEDIRDKAEQYKGKLSQIENNITKLHSNMKISLQKYDVVLDELESVESVDTGQMALESKTIQINMATTISLSDIFDDINISEEIPFVQLSRFGNDWYKVFDREDIPRKWIEDEPEKGLHLKIKIGSRILKCLWIRDKIEVRKVPPTINKNVIIEVVLRALGGRIDHGKITSKITSISGTFVVDDISFNKAVFAELINNHELFRYFMYINESGPKTITKKGRFLIHEKINDLSILVTPKIEDGVERVRIRVSKAVNLDQSEKVRWLFSKLMSIYESTKHSIIEEYSALLPQAPLLFKNFILKSPKMQVNKKTKIKLQNLKNKRPDIFREGYSRACLVERQPVIIDEDNISDYDSHRILKFNGGVFVCEDPIYQYPGLKDNKIEEDPNYSKDVPKFPCCFKTDQTKKGKRKRKSGVLDLSKSLAHIKKSSKLIEEGRFGYLPHFLTDLARKSGYQEIKLKQKFWSLLSSGVIQSPDSFLHCLERALKKGYQAKPKKEKIADVHAIRDHLSKRLHFNIAKQELYDYTDDEIKKILTDKDKFLDPRLWIRLFEVHYKCNIFIYQTDKNHLDGQVVIPRFSKAYLLRDIDSTIPSVFILMKKASSLVSWDWQCEIICEYKKNKKSHFLYHFKNNRLVTEAVKLLYDTNSVMAVTPEKSFYVRPVHVG